MKITPMEIKEYSLKKKALGLDPREVETLKDMAAAALEEANRERMALGQRVRELEERLAGHMKNEALLKDAITTTQKMSMDIKDNAKKEAELIIAEAKVRAEEIIRQARDHAREIQGEIAGLKKQRAEFEASLRALLDYHTTKILIDEEESRKSDEEANKIKYLP